MAQTGFTPISNYYSATATNVPTAGNLVAGELAINTADGKLFYKDSAGVVQTMASKDATAGTYSSITTSNLTIGTTQLGAGNASIMKNRIINGAMVIDQRNAGASVTPANDAYTLDRWQVNISDSSKFTIQQNAGSVTPPAGFTNYLGVTSSSAFSLAAGSYFVLDQKIEGFNIADLGWGTANAKTVTLSFWVRSSLTGTFGGVLRNSAENRSYPYTYTISAANTWEQKSVTIAGDTSGTWVTTNGNGIYVGFGLGVGSTYSGTAGAWAGSTYASATGATSIVSTNGATFYITGVQLEVGSSATGFEYRQYTTELALCQRYYEKSFDIGTAPVAGVAYANSFGHTFTAYVSTNCRSPNISFEVSKRTAPSMTFFRTDLSASNNSSWQWYNGSVWANSASATTSSNANTQGFQAEVISSSMSFGASYLGFGNWTASAEL